MKLVNTFSASLILSLAGFAASAEDECTHGMLFVADAESTLLRAMDLNAESLENLAVTASIDLPDIPVPELNLQITSTTQEVAIIYRGQETENYGDGMVRFVDTGVSLSADGHAESTGQLALVDNAGFDCARAIHFVRHDDKIAIFCDGIVTNVTQVNSTVWVVDEALFGTPDTSAIVYTTTLDGSHHGVGIPVDDNHVLYSLAQPERIDGNYTRAYALPHTFEVVDYDGNVLHSIADTTNADTSCAGFHGSWAIHNTFALAVSPGM